MSEKTYSIRSNAIRNARSILGKDAKQGVHFTISGTPGFYRWTRIDGTPTAVTASAKAKVASKTTKVKASRAKASRVTRKVRSNGKARRAKHKHTKGKVIPSTSPVLIAIKARPKSVKERGRKAGRKSLVTAAETSGKRRLMFRMISKTDGASLENLSDTLGWQKHTVRGAVSTIGSQFRVKIKSFRDAHRGRVYQVT